MKLCCSLPDGQLLLQEVILANTFWSRLKGLLGRASLPPQQGLLIRPCHSVHTLGMRFAIGVVFLNADNEILKILPELVPGRLSPVVKGSRQVLELHPQTLQAAQLQPQMKLCFEPC